MITEDEKQKAEEIRDYIEYLARFLDNQSVEKIKQARESAEKVDDEGFDTLLQQQFGRRLTK